MHTCADNFCAITHRVAQGRLRRRARAGAQAVRLVGRQVHLAQHREEEARVVVVGAALLLLGRRGRVGHRGGRRGLIHHLGAVQEPTAGGRAQRVQHVLQPQVQWLKQRHVRLLPVLHQGEEEPALARHRLLVLAGVVAARGERKVNVKTGVAGCVLDHLEGRVPRNGTVVVLVSSG